MRHKLVPQRVLFLLIAVALVLLISGFVSSGFGKLLAAMGDQPGGLVFEYVALGCGALLVIDLVCLVLAQAVNSLTEGDGPPDAE